MTVPLSVKSERLEAARQFGAALCRAMARHKVGQVQVAKHAKVARSAVVQWRHGRNLPTLQTAIRLSEYFGDGSLSRIVREGRTRPCERCGKPFLNEGGHTKKYCSEICLRVAQKLRVGVEPDVPVDIAIHLKAVVADIAAAMDELAAHQVAVIEMCSMCEPGGYCQTPECALRPISPIPLAMGFKEPDLVRRASGAWSPEHREKQLRAIREANARRWAKPGEREAFAEAQRDRHAGKSDAEHEAWVNRIKASKQTRAEVQRLAAAGVSRADIARQLSLSRARVTQILGPINRQAIAS